jgi:hypothetical protein
MNLPVPAGKIRCPNCSALNPEAAEWCGQCHQRFRAPEPPPPVVPHAAAPAGTPAAPGTVPPAPAVQASPGSVATQPDPGAVGIKRGAFEVTETGIQWTCRVCESKNSIDVQVCAACGAPFAETVRTQREDEIKGDPNMAALYSLFFPGAGHGYLGLWGDAIGRGIISVFVVGVAVAGFLSDAPLVGASFALLAFGFWIIAAHDAFREASHQPGQVIIRTKHYGFVMLGILAVLFLMLMVTYMGLRAQRGG